MIELMRPFCVKRYWAMRTTSFNNLSYFVPSLSTPAFHFQALGAVPVGQHHHHLHHLLLHQLSSPHPRPSFSVFDFVLPSQLSVSPHSPPALSASELSLQILFGVESPTLSPRAIY